MIYFDGVHMMTDGSLDELDRAADAIGLARKHFQPHRRHPHFDVWGAPAKRIRVNCTTREMLRKCRR